MDLLLQIESKNFVGKKPPLRPRHIWSIRTKLQIEGKERDLALFNLEIHKLADVVGDGLDLVDRRAGEFR